MHDFRRFGILWCLFLSAACGSRSLLSMKDGAAGGQAAAASDASNGDVPWDFPPPPRDAAPVLLDATLIYDVVLDKAEAERLQRLGAGLGCELLPGDPILVRRGIRATDPDLRDWAYLAIEKMAACPGLLDGPFVDDVFPYLMATVEGSDLEAAQYALRGLGSLSTLTDLLTRNEIDQAYALAVRLRGGSDVEDRLHGISLLGSLLRNLDAAQMYDTYAAARSAFAKWCASHPGPLVLSSDADRQTVLDYSGAKLFLASCAYVRDATQASEGFRALSAAFTGGQLAISALTSVAQLVRLLVEPERGQAVDLVIAGLADTKGWYSQGSGRYIPAHYAADALEVVEPLLTQDESRRAIAAMATQASHPNYTQVFGPIVERLGGRLADAG